ncbi:MAG: GxxExxY protein [Gammaproteobacteria bacterium]
MNQERDPLTEKVIGLAIEVHRELGPGLNENIYEAALEFELNQACLQCSRQVAIDVRYKGRTLGMGFRVDLIVERTLPIELKAVDQLSELHKAQLITYLRLLSLKRGLLINFNAMPLRVGIRRLSL